MSDPHEYDWQPMATYSGESFTLFRDAAGTYLFGQGKGERWYETVDGQLIEKAFTPIAWSVVPEELWSDWEGG